eukprot:gene9248-10955_t
MATLVGLDHARVYTFGNVILSGYRQKVELPTCDKEQAGLIRHAGWIGSLCVAIGTTFLLYETDYDAEDWHGNSTAVLFAVWKTALDAAASDLFRASTTKNTDPQTINFFCGNFGILLLDSNSRSKVLQVLQKMIEVTMVRGAQSGGVVTYAPSRGGNHRGCRTRVVNGKRTNLAKLLISKLNRNQARQHRGRRTELFQGKMLRRVLR